MLTLHATYTCSTCSTHGHVTAIWPKPPEPWATLTFECATCGTLTAHDQVHMLPPSTTLAHMTLPPLQGEARPRANARSRGDGTDSPQDSTD